MKLKTSCKHMRWFATGEKSPRLYLLEISQPIDDILYISIIVKIFL